MAGLKRAACLSRFPSDVGRWALSGGRACSDRLFAEAVTRPKHLTRRVGGRDAVWTRPAAAFALRRLTCDPATVGCVILEPAAPEFQGVQER
jgi:hypothetical protein